MGTSLRDEPRRTPTVAKDAHGAPRQELHTSKPIVGRCPGALRAQAWRRSRFCIDYRGINELSEKDRYPLPLIRETLRNMSVARWFTKLDVIAAFHKIRMAKGEEWKTAFRTRYGLFEWLVMPFGLSGAPASFQRYINYLLREFLDDFVSAYIDDIHHLHGRLPGRTPRQSSSGAQILETRDCNAISRRASSKLPRSSTSASSSRPGKASQWTPRRSKRLGFWTPPKNLKGVRGFLGFANFYRVFIPEFADIAAPLTNLTKKSVDFVWDEACQKSFETLKERFITAPILCHFDPEKPTIVEADASGYATGGVLAAGTRWRLVPLRVSLEEDEPREANYEIHDKELLAIVQCLKEWGPELRMVKHFTVLSDHKNLKYFRTARFLTERQMRWSEVLSRFNFTLEFRPGKLSGRPDALSVGNKTCQQMQKTNACWDDSRRC